MTSEQSSEKVAAIEKVCAYYEAQSPPLEFIAFPVADVRELLNFAHNARAQLADSQETVRNQRRRLAKLESAVEQTRRANKRLHSELLALGADQTEASTA